MRILNNNSGSMLIVLIIAMTLIAILGSSFVSIIGSKNEGFTFILNGQKANMIARAGTEWAIRYISDGLSDTGSTYYSNLPMQPATNKVFASGSFSVNWDYVTNDYITVNGTYQGITETITLLNFRRYLQPITLIPDTNYRPKYRTTSRRFLDVFVMGNSDTTISRIDLTTNTSGMILRYIYVQDIETGVTTTIFDYTDTNFADCTYPAQTNCIRTVFWGFVDLGLSMKSTDQSFDSGLAKLKASSIGYNKTYRYTFEFLYNAPLSAPQHKVIFYSAPVVSEIKFTP